MYRQCNNTTFSIFEFFVGSVISLIDNMNGPDHIKRKMQQQLQNIEVKEKKPDVLLTTSETDDKTTDNCKTRIRLILIGVIVV
jgi:hypothetical protein